MALRVYNTLSGKKEEFVPLKEGAVNMYVCGITPYDECHIGHARCYVVFDVIRRWLEHKGYRVQHVQNFTDIDNKLIERAKKKNISPRELAEENIAKYFEVMEKLNVQKAGSYPRVTEHIGDIIKAVLELMKKGFAYEIDGSIYYEVEKFNGYGKLSHRKKDDLTAGARVEVDEKKKNPLDFALWKKAKPEEESWDSPWGRGRPGWHIECSVMSGGGTLDIHGGGMDLIFPHHENEIAQSEALTGRQFSKYWLHNGFVTINEEKMSKSLGNVFSVADIFGRYSPAALRFLLLTRHYRSPLDFSDDKLVEAGKGLANIIKIINSNTVEAETAEALELEYNEFEKSFIKAMDDDFNTAEAIGRVFKFIKFIESRPGFNAGTAIISKVKRMLEDVLGINLLVRGMDTEKVKQLIELRNKARKAGNWKESDAIRDRLREMGVMLEDTPSGTLWKPVKSG